MTTHQLLAAAVALLCGLIIPAVVDLVTTSALNPRVKAALAAVLAALAGALSADTWAPGQPWGSWVLAVVLSFATAMASHYAGWTDPIQAATPNVGVGPKTPTVPASPIGA